MTVLALLLALSASQLALIDETVSLAAGEVRGLNVVLNQRRAVLDVSYETLGSDSAIGVGLIGPADGVGAPRGVPHQYLRMIAPDTTGGFRFPAAELGEYQLILDNRGEESVAVEVRLRVTLAFGETGTLRPGIVPLRRRTAVVALSTLFFLTVVLFSGRRLMQAFRRRTPSAPPPLF